MALVDRIPQAGVRGLSASEGELFVLLENSVEVYEIAYLIFFAQIADGQQLYRYRSHRGRLFL